jgi:succinate-acetate transporter protein
VFVASAGALSSSYISGLFSFASTTFILSLYNVNARGVAVPNVVVGMACFCGGLAQLLAGMWEFPRGNVFGATG